jgi:hypothetical protein
MDLFFQELYHRLHNTGYMVGAVIDRTIAGQKVKYIVNDRETEIVLIDTDGTVYKVSDRTDDFKRISGITREVEKYVSAYENAPPDSRLPDGWKTISSVGGVFVFAATPGNDHEQPMRFATWRYDGLKSHTGVWSGNYFWDYANAEKDFFDRCGYERPFFSEEEMRVIYDGLTSGGTNDHYHFQDIIDKLESRFPDLAQESEDEPEPEM